MSNNKDLQSPTMRPWPGGTPWDKDLGAAANGGQVLRGVDILAPGKFFFIDIEDQAENYDFSGITAGVPYRFWCQIKTIVGSGSGSVGNGTTGTNIAATALKGFH